MTNAPYTAPICDVIELNLRCNLLQGSPEFGDPGSAGAAPGFGDELTI